MTRSRTRTRTVVLAFAASLALSAAMAAGAGANFHLMKVKEVYSGGANADADYIELQAFAGGQNQLAGHSVSVFNAVGLGTSYPIPANFGNGADQASFLIGDTAVQAAFGVAPDLVVAGLDIDAYKLNGAACFADSTPPDCVAWGTFAEQGGFPDPAAAASEVPGGIPDGSSLNRNITRGCATLLESPADDLGASSADFVLAPPTPRNNASAPLEKSCTPATATKKRCKKKKKKSNSVYARSSHDQATSGKRKKKGCKRKKKGGKK